MNPKYDSSLHDKLLETLTYNMETGNFVKNKTSEVVGTRLKDNCVRIYFNKKTYPAHILAWFYVTGAFPSKEILHKDKDNSNNKWHNLIEKEYKRKESECKISKDLNVGKAGEHLVCFDLLTKGYNAFLADQGLPYDVILEKEKALYKIQVKTRSIKRKHGKGVLPNYRFGLRVGKGSAKTLDKSNFDYMAFVFLDIKKVAYLKTKDLISDRTNKVKQIIEFYSSTDIPKERKIMSKLILENMNEI